jgi:hypothetical protein
MFLINSSSYLFGKRETFLSFTLFHKELILKHFKNDTLYVTLVSLLTSFHLCKSISTGAQYVTLDSKIYCEKIKMCLFSSGNWFFCTKFVQLAMASKRHNTVVHLQKDCNRLDVTAAQYFWLVDHNDWSMWFAISSYHKYAVPVTILLVGLPQVEML